MTARNSLGGPNPRLTSQALAPRTAERIFTKYFGGQRCVGREAPVRLDRRTRERGPAAGYLIAMSGREQPVRVTPYENGPYLLRGPFELVDQDGRTIATGRRTVALCRCGRSRTRPFCDGTHKLIDFAAPSGAERPPRGSESPG